LIGNVIPQILKASVKVDFGNEVTTVSVT